MIDFLSESKKIKDEIINIRRDIHQYPELGFEEERTSEIIKNYLKKEGIAYTSMAKTGVCGMITGEGKGNKNRGIGVRADMDALPIEEKRVSSYSSRILGKMHACGHDAHVAILLGIAKILNENRHEFAGTVKLLFEPAEETIGGAPLMIKEGALNDPNVDVIIGLHVTEDLECGMIRIKKDMVNAASNPFKIVINGKGGHGAAPSTTVDPIVISSSVILALQTIISREIAPVNPAVISIGSIHAGKAKNVIPDEVELTGIIRTTTKEDREFIIKRFEGVVNGICETMRGEAEIVIEESYPCLYNDEALVDLVDVVASRILGNINVIEQKRPSMGVESFAYFANERPSVFYYLGTGNKIKKIDSPAHSSYFDIDEDAIPIGIALQCGIVFEYLTR